MIPEFLESRESTHFSKITLRDAFYLLHIRGLQVLEGDVEPQGQKPIVEVLCEERDHRGLDGDVLGSILATNSENGVDFEHLRD